MPNSFDRRAILQILAGGIVSGPLAAAASAKDPAVVAGVPTALTFKENAKLDAEPFGDLRLYAEGETEQLKSLTVGSLELKPGQSPHPPHTHPEEEIMIITEGHGEISLEGKVKPVGPGTVMVAGANRLHGILNTGSSRLTFYYVKWIGK